MLKINVNITQENLKKITKISDNVFMKMNFLKKILFALFIGFLNCNFVFALELYKADAVVSYYGDKFHGKPTSSGETYNMNDLTCACKTLPFGTILKVTNLSNKKSVQVRVNDRGPFVTGRELDLSKAAAVKIDMISSGTTHVKIEIVKMGEDTALSRQTAEAAKKMMEKKEIKPSKTTETKTEHKTEATKPTVAAGTQLYDIQVAAFKDKDNAETFARKLVRKGFKNVVLRRSGETYRVVIKDISQKNLSDVEIKLNDEGYYDFVVKKIK